MRLKRMFEIRVNIISGMILSKLEMAQLQLVVFDTCTEFQLKNFKIVWVRSDILTHVSLIELVFSLMGPKPYMEWHNLEFGLLPKFGLHRISLKICTVFDFWINISLECACISFIKQVTLQLLIWNSIYI